MNQEKIYKLGEKLIMALNEINTLYPKTDEQMYVEALIWDYVMNEPEMAKIFYEAVGIV